MSGPLEGPISDRLRAQSDPHDPAWHPSRPAPHSTTPAVPAGVSGYQQGAPVSDARGMHYAAAENAIQVIGELQETISVGTEKCDIATGAVLGATGSSTIESAVNAMNMLQGAKNLLEEAFRASQAAVEELERYQRGF